MRDNRTYGSEGGAAQSNESSLPLSVVGPYRQAGLSAIAEPRPDNVEIFRRQRRGSETEIEVGDTSFDVGSRTAT
jgi:hypothetical protein